MQIGLRGPYARSDELSFAFSRGIDTVGIDEVRWDLHAVVSQVRRLVQKGAIYVSIDLAGLDPCVRSRHELSGARRHDDLGAAADAQRAWSVPRSPVSTSWVRPRLRSRRDHRARRVACAARNSRRTRRHAPQRAPGAEHAPLGQSRSPLGLDSTGQSWKERLRLLDSSHYGVASAARISAGPVADDGVHAELGDALASAGVVHGPGAHDGRSLLPARERTRRHERPLRVHAVGCRAGGRTARCRTTRWRAWTSQARGNAGSRRAMAATNSG